MPSTLANKKPAEVADYRQDWDKRLAEEESITSSSWSVAASAESPAALTVQSGTYTDRAVTVWLAAGTAGVSYVLTNMVETSGNRTLVGCYRLYVEAC
ncbi:hypothetical protein [Psychromarinibacter halotolerans]|uniref:Uncharacterized protein n=1 Tax=Psychromarinibacter halotolerans TaxID=1775175 RepID=A0ABV7GZS4_9RHOB|nr:hypothetical protein [Psychromarinibacter halotolerans]MDF0598444.1 hypothetical protein [Psychromarinibacter halotolerans]